MQMLFYVYSAFMFIHRVLNSSYFTREKRVNYRCTPDTFHSLCLVQQKIHWVTRFIIWEK